MVPFISSFPKQPANLRNRHFRICSTMTSIFIIPIYVRFANRFNIFFAPAQDPLPVLRPAPRFCRAGCAVFQRRARQCTLSVAPVCVPYCGLCSCQGANVEIFLHSRNISTYKKHGERDGLLKRRGNYLKKHTKKLAYASFFTFDCVRRGISLAPSAALRAESLIHRFCGLTGLVRYRR